MKTVEDWLRCKEHRAARLNNSMKVSEKLHVVGAVVKTLVEEDRIELNIQGGRVQERADTGIDVQVEQSSTILDQLCEGGSISNAVTS